MNNFIEKIIKDLSPREQVILNFRFGLKDSIVHTLEEAGQEFGVTRERIRQIEVKALEKIKRAYDIEMNEVMFMWGFDAYRCLCGKYKRKRYIHVICDKCGVEVQPSHQIMDAVKNADTVRHST